MAEQMDFDEQMRDERAMDGVADDTPVSASDQRKAYQLVKTQHPDWDDELCRLISGFKAQHPRAYQEEMAQDIDGLVLDQEKENLKELQDCTGRYKDLTDRLTTESVNIYDLLSPMEKVVYKGLDLIGKGEAYMETKKAEKSPQAYQRKLEELRGYISSMDAMKAMAIREKTRSEERRRETKKRGHIVFGDLKANLAAYDELTKKINDVQLEQRVHTDDPYAQDRAEKHLNAYTQMLDDLECQIEHKHMEMAQITSDALRYDKPIRHARKLAKVAGTLSLRLHRIEDALVSSKESATSLPSIEVLLGAVEYAQDNFAGLKEYQQMMGDVEDQLDNLLGRQNGSLEMLLPQMREEQGPYESIEQRRGHMDRLVKESREMLSYLEQGLR